MPSTIIFLSKDIFFWPVVKAAAQEVDSQLVIISKLDDPKLANVASEAVSTCVIDLAAIEVAGLVSLMEGLRAKFAVARIIAFGSHVHEARLACAEQAGCDLVLSRGQFSARPAEYLR
jgi:hypothetical protein